MRRPDYSDIPEVFRRAMEGEGWNLEQQQQGGGDGPPRPPFPPARAWWRDRRVWFLGLVILILVSFDWLVNTYTNWLWFQQVGYESTWLRLWSLQVGVFAVAFAVAAVALLGTWQTARRTAGRGQTGPSLLNLPGLRWVVALIGLFFAFTFATAAQAQWQTVLHFIYRVPFGQNDPIFGRDISFYLFELPFYQFLQNWFMPLLVFAMLGVVGLYTLRYLPQLQGGRLTAADIPVHLRRTLAICGGIFFLLWAVGYQLNIYELVYSPRGVAFGASYTDMNATRWSLYVQTAAILALALVSFYNYFQLQWKPILAIGAVWLSAALLLGGIYPAILQRFVVEPTELARETQYLEYNIAFTRLAFGLDKVEVRSFGPVAPLTQTALDDNEEAMKNIRLWDYRPLQQTYAQLQELRPYYQFSSIDIDRYMVNGEERQVMLAARELDKANLPNVTWVNEKLEFTHGYGVVMNPVDRFTNQGRPEFFISDLPPRSTVDINVSRPEVYFGETTTDVVYAGSNREEFSYPQDEQNMRTHYAGTGGVPLGNWFQRMIFAIRFGEVNLLFSEYITPETQVMFNRQVQQRIRTITPFLSLDYDPYLVIHDGRLVWMQDAYTTSSEFPYSEPTSTGLNYIRNSVKITVDAYEGTVLYYIVDTEDPIIQTYARAFPDLFRPFSDMPAGLQEHIRYPEDLFRIQTTRYLRYHMTDVQTFYNQEDLRAIPDEIFDSAAQPMEPYYVMFRLPGEAETEFLLIQPFTPSEKPNMIAWIAARNDPENYGHLVAYELPRQELVVGPIQVEGFIDQEPEISQQFSLWDQGGSNIIRGNLIVIPLNNSFLYVEPIYLLSDTSALPELKRVIVASGEKIVMRATLEEALDALISNDAIPVVIEVPDTVEPTTAEPTPPLAADATVEQLIKQANTLFTEAQEAQQNGDWATYGAKLDALAVTLQQLESITAAAGE